MNKETSNVYLGTLYDSSLLKNGDISETAFFNIMFKRNALKAVDGDTYTLYEQALGEYKFLVNSKGKVIKHNMEISESVKKSNFNFKDVVSFEEMRIKLLLLLMGINTFSLEGRELYEDCNINSFKILRQLLTYQDEELKKDILLEEYQNILDYYILATEGSINNLISFILENDLLKYNKEENNEKQNDEVKKLQLVPKKEED